MGALSSKDITANNDAELCTNKSCPERVLKDTRYDQTGYPTIYYNRNSSQTGTSSYSQIHYNNKPPVETSYNRPPSTVQHMDRCPGPSTAQPVAGNQKKPSLTSLYHQCTRSTCQQLSPQPISRPSSDYFCYKGREYLRCGKEDPVGRSSKESVRNCGRPNTSSPGCCQKSPAAYKIPYNPLTNTTGYRTHGCSLPPRRFDYYSPKEDTVCNLWNRLPPVAASRNTPSLQALRQARGYRMPTLYYDCREALRTLAILTYEIIRNCIVFCIIVVGIGMRLCSEFYNASRTTKFMVLLTCFLFVLVTLYVRRHDSPWYGEIC